MPVQLPGGALNVTLNDTTTKGSYMPDGSLRVTNVAGAGIVDASGALRISNTTGAGVYAALADAIRYSDAGSDGLTGVYSQSGAIRMQGAGFPAPGNPSIDMWFGRGLYFGKQPSDITFVRGQNTATNITPDLTPATLPTFQSYTAGTPRIITSGSGFGYLTEGAKTQFYSTPLAYVDATTATLSADTYAAWCIADPGVTIQLSAGTPGNVSGLGNVSQGTPSLFTVTSTGSTITTTKSGVGTVYYMQIENSGAGSAAFPTSIINPSGSSIRATDQATFTTLAPIATNGVGTYLTIGRALSPNLSVTVAQMFDVSDTTTANRIAAAFQRVTAGQNVARATVNINADLGSDPWGYNARGAIAFSVANGQQFECFNGGAVATGNYTLPSGMTAAVFGRTSNSSTVGHWYGYIERFVFWPDAKSSAFVQAVSTL